MITIIIAIVLAWLFISLLNAYPQLLIGVVLLGVFGAGVLVFGGLGVGYYAMTQNDKQTEVTPVPPPTKNKVVKVDEEKAVKKITDWDLTQSAIEQALTKEEAELFIMTCAVKHSKKNIPEADRATATKICEYYGRKVAAVKQHN